MYLVWPHYHLPRDQPKCLICLQPTPAVSAARGVHVRALLLCSCIKLTRESTPVPDVRRKFAKSCRACRYWLELGIKKIEGLTKGAGVNIQDLLAAQSRYWATSPAIEPGPILGLYSPHPEDMRPRSLRKPLIDFVKKHVNQDMILDFQMRLNQAAPPRDSPPRVTYDDDNDDDSAATPKFFI